jgi:Tfp pilus assembly protein PilO
VSELTNALALIRHVASEHRRTVYILLAALAVNVAAFAFVVHPLQTEVATVEQRTQAAEDALTAARADYGRANGTLTGKDRALKELDTFYTSVLPTDLSGARRLTYARLASLAANSHLAYERSKYEPIVERGSSLTRLKVTMELTGSYADARDFIHALEAAKEFVTIDSVELAEGFANDQTLRLSLQLSTYFRTVRP